MPKSPLGKGGRLTFNHTYALLLPRVATIPQCYSCSCNISFYCGAVVFFLTRFFHLSLLFLFRKWRLYRTRQSVAIPDAEKALPGVSVLKPLCSGQDSHLFSNLETFFTLDYPKVTLTYSTQAFGREKHMGFIGRFVFLPTEK